MATTLLLRLSLSHPFSLSSKLLSSTFSPIKTYPFHLKATMMEKREITEEEEVVVSKKKKKIFVTGATGKRIVEQLLTRGFAVKAGVRDVDKAKSSFSVNDQDLQFVKADVTEGLNKLAEAIGDDADAIICATDFRRSWDLLAPWKAGY